VAITILLPWLWS